MEAAGAGVAGIRGRADHFPGPIRSAFSQSHSCRHFGIFHRDGALVWRDCAIRRARGPLCSNRLPNQCPRKACRQWSHHNLLSTSRPLGPAPGRPRNRGAPRALSHYQTRPAREHPSLLRRASPSLVFLKPRRYVCCRPITLRNGVLASLHSTSYGVLTLLTYWTPVTLAASLVETRNSQDQTGPELPGCWRVTCPPNSQLVSTPAPKSVITSK